MFVFVIYMEWLRVSLSSTTSHNPLKNLNFIRALHPHRYSNLCRFLSLYDASTEDFPSHEQRNIHRANSFDLRQNFCPFLTSKPFEMAYTLYALYASPSDLNIFPTSNIL